jgi:hypothetical protein
LGMVKLIVLGGLLVVLVAVIVTVRNRPESESPYDSREHQAGLVQRDVAVAAKDGASPHAARSNTHHTGAPKPSKRDPEGTLIPRSMSDKGNYYLLEVKRSGDVVSALHKRVGVDSVGWTKTETNCRKWLMRELGYTEDSPVKMKRKPTKWFELVEGSSKSDLAHFVCR